MAINNPKYNSTPPTVADGQETQLQADANGNLLVAGAVTATLASTTVTSVVPGTTATSLGKAEDAQHVTGDTGVAVWGVRNTTGAALAGSQLDYSPIAVAADGSVLPGAHTITRITAEAQVKGSAGVLHTLSISPLTATPTAGLLTVYDSLTETGTVLYSEWVFATTPGHTIILDANFGTGLYIGFDATLANVSVTATYR